MKYFAPLVMAALVVGCGQQPQANPQPAAPATAVEPAAAQVEAPVACAPGYAPLPQGLSLDLAMHLRADSIQANAQGKMRRVIALEFLAGTEAEALAKVEAGMAAVGFKAGERKTDAIGHPLLTFTKPAYGVVHVVATPVPEEGASNPSAQGVLIINAPFDGDPAVGTFAAG